MTFGKVFFVTNIFFPLFTLYIRYKMDIGWIQEERRISEGKSASWRSRVCDEQ